MTNFNQQLFPPDFLQFLASLKLLLKRKTYGEKYGHLQSFRPGVGMEFLGYRAYSPGDDIRYLDWNLFSRTEELFIKEFTKEQSKPVYVLIDSSASMAYGAPHKLLVVCQLAIAIAYIAVHNGHLVKFVILKEDSIDVSRYFNHPGQLYEMLQYLSDIEAQGVLNLGQSLTKIHYNLNRGIIFICSDLLAAQNSWPKLQSLVVKNHEVSILHLLSPLEVKPKLHGEANLIDIETGQEISLYITEELLTHYRQALAAFKEKWLRFCQNHRIQYHFATTDIPLKQIIVDALHPTWG